MHDGVHGWMRGDMGVMSSPNDPIFFMHHAQIDRIWEARTHSQEDEGEAYHIIPVSGWGQFFFALLFVGLAVFLIGVISGSVAFAYAGVLALGGMILFFLSALIRLFFD